MTWLKIISYVHDYSDHCCIVFKYGFWPLFCHVLWIVLIQMKYKEIKKEYYEEKIDAGPQSRILEGTTWDEAQKINVRG